MKKLIVAVLGLMCCAAVFAADKKTLTLAEAREQINAVLSDPAKMGEITSQLSAEDQNAFLVEVNKAISQMPGSNEQKTAKYLAVDREALLTAKKGNLQTMVATMFATVKLEPLTVLSERYAEDLFSRSSDSSKKLTDEQFVEIAVSTVGAVAKKCEGLADSAPRDTLAVYLFGEASEDSIPGLEDKLLEVAISDPQVRAVAKSEWLTAAKDKEGSDRFSALLGYAEAGRAPNVDVVLKIAGPQMLTAMLNDLAQGVMDSSGKQIMPVTMGESATGRDVTTASQAASVATTSTADKKPISANPLAPWNPSYSRGQAEEVKETAKVVEKIIEEEEEPEPEPKPYQYQD